MRIQAFTADSRQPAQRVLIWMFLGGVDKFEPVSGGGDMDHAEEAFGELVVACGDGTVDFEAAEEAFDMIAFLVERPVVFDLDPAV